MIKSTLRLMLTGIVGLAMCSMLNAQGKFHNLGDGNAVTGLSFDGTVAAGTNPSEYFFWTESSGVNGIGGQTAGGGVGGQAKISDDGTRISGTDFNASQRSVRDVLLRYRHEQLE